MNTTQAHQLTAKGHKGSRRWHLHRARLVSQEDRRKERIACPAPRPLSPGPGVAALAVGVWGVASMSARALKTLWSWRQLFRNQQRHSFWVELNLPCQIGPQILKLHLVVGCPDNGEAMKRVSHTDLLGLSPILNNLITPAHGSSNANETKNLNCAL
jgi:hypothetical protein